MLYTNSIGQQEFCVSPYAKLYDILLPEDHEYRKLLKLTDFTFILSELKTNYCEDNGRNSTDPILLFKCLFLKSQHNLSDERLVKRIITDMSFKFFLGLNPEETEIFDPSVLTKFRRKRLKNIDFGNKVITESLTIAKELGLISSTTIIMDATHTKNKYCKKLGIYS